MKFTDMLQHCWDVNQSLLCVGLDPDPKRFPKQFESNKHAILDFCWDIVKSTGDLVCAFKPQIAYFASSGAEDQLKELIARIHSEYPEVPVILDAKRGDIGSTAKHYAKEAFERFGADCVTLSPYMGFDSVEPYLAKKVEQCNTTGQRGLVIGGTYPKELASVRALTPQLNFLVPGIGAQGGDINACVQSGMNAQKTGMVINSSRAILYASSDEDFKEKARAVAMQTRDAINAARGL